MALCDGACPPKGSKDPQGTRRAVLFAAYEEIHRQGFQAASLTNILATTGLTKGALYHHFANKQQLGYAVLDEVIRPEVMERWVIPLQQEMDPIQAMIDVLLETGAAMTDKDIWLGCPLNNLAQEMSPMDEGFRLRINSLFEEWRGAIAAAMLLGKQKGKVRQEIDEHAVAAFIVGALEGCMGMAKNARSRTVLMLCGQGLVEYLSSLRP
jgi:AcrR family transcriptional regulator